MSGEAGDGKEAVEEEPSVEALTGEQLKTADGCSQLTGKHRLTAWSPWKWPFWTVHVHASTDSATLKSVYTAA